MISLKSNGLACDFARRQRTYAKRSIFAHIHVVNMQLPEASGIQDDSQEHYLTATCDLLICTTGVI